LSIDKDDCDVDGSDKNDLDKDGSGLNRLGAQSGLIAQSAYGLLNETDLLTAHYLGQRVAQVSKKFAG
jgi:hypothetical protein